MGKMPGRVVMRVVLFLYCLWLFLAMATKEGTVVQAVYLAGIGIGLLGLTVLAVAPSASTNSGK